MTLKLHKRLLAVVTAGLLVGSATSCAGQGSALDEVAASSEGEGDGLGEQGPDDSVPNEGPLPPVVPGGELVDLSAFDTGPPEHIDPLLSYTIGASEVGDSVYDGLTTVDYRDPTSPVVRGLVAESWEANEDATEWTFQLREGLQFSNGEPVLPSSFKRGWEIGAAYGGTYSYLYDLIEGGTAVTGGETTDIAGVEADDDAMTLTVDLVAPWSEFDAAVSFHSFYPMPEERPMPDDDDSPFELSEWETDQMIGNGPFMLESWEPDLSEVTMVPNPDWDGTRYDSALRLPQQPYLDRVTFVAMPDPETAFVAFEAGEGDVVRIPATQSVGASDDYGTVLGGPALGVYFYTFNQDDPQVGGPDNYLLRRAIMQAIDRQRINDLLYGDTRSLPTGFTPEGMPGFEPDLCEYCEYDPEAAAADFEAWQDEGNSLADPIPIQINEGLGHEEVVEMIIDDLAAVGIDAEVDPRPSPTYFEDMADGECVLCRSGWIADYPAYGNFMYDLFHSSSLGANNYGYDSAEFDAVVEEAQSETDPDARAELFHEAERILLNDDAAVVPINWYRSDIGYHRSTVLALYQDPSFHIEWETVQAQP